MDMMPEPLHEIGDQVMVKNSFFGGFYRGKVISRRLKIGLFFSRWEYLVLSNDGEVEKVREKHMWYVDGGFSDA